MSKHTNHELEPVVAVCGNEARVYGPKEDNGVRPLWAIKTFPHRGAALQYANEYETPRSAA